MTSMMTLCHNAERRSAQCRNLLMFMLNIIILSVVMLNVVMLNVIMLSVVAPSLLHLPKLLNLFKHFFQSGVKLKKNLIFFCYCFGK
jgi:hypothetical protein